MPKALLAWSMLRQDVRAATSGGAFTAVARHILQHGGVVVGAAYDDQFAVRHIVAKSPDDLYRVSRSKYVQSDTQSVYHEVEKLLKEGRTVLFCGTTCQAYALLAYCSARRIDRTQLYLVDIVCQGVPSPKLLREYLGWHTSKRDSSIADIGMRERDAAGLYGFTSHMRIDFSDGSRYTRDMEWDPYARLYFSGLATRPSCHTCPFKTLNRLSDVTLGDCWFSRCLADDDAVPYEVTLCLPHGSRGDALLRDCSTLKLVDVDNSKAVTCNGGMLYASRKPHPLRDEFLKSLGMESFGMLYRRYLPKTVKETMKRLRGTIKPLALKVAPVLVKRRAMLRQRKEFERRIQRSIPPEACGVRVFK